jgi:broad specificity phosphatase PhoE
VGRIVVDQILGNTRGRLWLVRHGAVEDARPREFYGCADVHLSSAGRCEALDAARALSGTPFAGILASPLERARIGAQYIAQECDVDGLTVDPRLREIDRGRWVGLTPVEVEQRFPGDLLGGRSDPANWRGNGGESLGDLRQRVLEAQAEHLSSHPDEDWCLVAHSYPILALLADATGLDYDAWTNHRVPTGSISRITYTGDRANVDFCGWAPRENPGDSLP